MLQLMKTNTNLSPVREMFNSFADGLAGSALPANLPLDIVEMSDKYEITASVPGLARDQIDLELDGGVLTISTSNCCQKETPEPDPEACDCAEPDSEVVTVLRKERVQASASRSIRLPVDVNDDNVCASLENGLLTITVTKPDAKTPRKLTID